MKVEKIIVHHSVSAGGTVASIRNYHITKRGFRDIGYNAIVRNINPGPEGMVEDGRPEDMVGAHCIGMNDKSMGICFIGTYDKMEPSEAMLRAGAEKIAGWIKKYGLRISDIETHHKNAFWKSCPGWAFPMAKLQEYVQDIIAPDKPKVMPLVKYKMRGEAVKLMQQLLKDKGYKIAVDGIFGRKTSRALTQYQKDNGLYPDAICGKLTWAKLTGA
jgi:N-acetylmuramoyl-L-alanine amidase